MGRTSYAIAIGSNRSGRFGSPVETIRAAADGLGARALSRIRQTAALGPAGRRFANAAILVDSELTPPDMLRLLKATERGAGRRAGRRWGPRALDLDIILWSDGMWAGPGLVVPHPAFSDRRFVLEPLAELVPDWRDPVSGATVRQLAARARRRSPVDHRGTRS